MRRVMRVAAARFVALGFDDSGAALAVTIVMFSLMILAFASVYAIGVATRDRIHLQNAADAAAYSAAVVQADALSRLATINKAMSWTYVQQCKREMDYIVYKWLKKTLEEYDKDHDNARSNHLATDCPIHRSEKPVFPLEPWYWSIGYAEIAPAIDLNGKWVVVPPKSLMDEYPRGYARLIREAVSYDYGTLPKFFDHLLGQNSSADDVMGSDSELARQIDRDSEAIRSMNDAEEDIANLMKGWMREAAEGTLDANIPRDWRGETRWSYHHDERSSDEEVSYLRVAKNEREDERQFCSASEREFSDERYPDDMFEKGIDKWFVRDSGCGSGIKRKYVQNGSSALHSGWSWYWGRCHYDGEDHMLLAWDSGSGEVYGNDPDHNYYETETAKPRFLTKSYFGEAGTVSVGVARRADNVWKRIIGSADGIFAAFTPSVGWSWAYSSAKAGYHRVTDSNSGSRAFDISWRGDGDDHGYESSGGGRKYWNLCVTDWDAMFLPVRKAKTDAISGRWTSGDTSFLANWATGDWKPLGGGGAGGGMASVNAPQGLNGTLDWGSLTDVMYH